MIFILIALFGGLLVGGLAGWFFGSRPVAEWKARFAERDGEAKDLSEKLSRMAPELATMSDRAARADELARKLDEEREAHGALKARAAGFEEQKRLLEESRANLLKEFENTGAKVLGAAQEKFLASASERFGHSEKTNEEKLKALLSPVGERLAKYEKQVAELEEKRTDAFGRLNQQIIEMQKTQDQVRQEAANLVNSLRNAPKTRGRWGEQQLKNVLIQCGLSEYTDFELEKSVATEEGRLRPDAIVNIPGEKKLIIDAKVSLNDYQDAFNANTDEEREKSLTLHARSVRNHAKSLGSKEYQRQFEGAADFVVMFVPGENYLNAALEQDRDLWEDAFKQRVLIATPTNLVAIARTVESVWSQEKLAKEAQEIGKLGGLLYDSIAKVSSDYQTLGNNLARAVKNYNDFGRTLDGHLLSRAKRLSEKQIAKGKGEIADPEYLEAFPRGVSESSSSPMEVEEDATQIEDSRKAAE